MKVLSFVFAFLYQLVLGVAKLVAIVLSIIYMALRGLYSLVEILAKVLWELFSHNFLANQRRIFATIGKPKCELCGKPKMRHNKVVYYEPYETWIHQDCQNSIILARLIEGGYFRETVAFFKMKAAGKLNFSLKTTVDLLRKYKDPYVGNLFLSIYRAKTASHLMSIYDAARILHIDSPYFH